MGKVTIAEIAGRVGGGGCEFVSSFDMRFGVDGKTIVNQMEVPLGILPGGGGTVRWTNLTNRSRIFGKSNTNRNRNNCSYNSTD